MSRISTPPESVRPTGHQDHFLSRLDRLAVPEVELALGLYRDHELVRFLLAALRLPEGAERVALSLDDPKAGPFVIVTREGRFVTCLGRGMKPGHCPIVTRAQLDALSARHERFAEALALEAKGGGMHGIVSRLILAGDAICREEMAVACAMQPLYAGQVFSLMIDTARIVLDARGDMLTALRRPGPPGRREQTALHAMWQGMWQVGHLALLSAHGIRPLLDAVDPASLQRAATAFSGTLFQQWSLFGAARGIWAAARIGKVLLPAYKEGYDRADTVLGFAEMHLVLALFGLRHQRLRAEMQKELRTAPCFWAGHHEVLEELVQLLATMVELAYTQPEVLHLRQVRRGREEMVARTRHLPASSGMRFSRPEDVPEDLALTMAANLEGEFAKDQMMLVHLYSLLPWLSRAKVEDFYLPRRWMEAVRRPWTVARTRSMLGGLMVEYEVTMAKQRAREPPKRNAECPCGSGKKYKKCCGA